MGRGWRESMTSGLDLLYREGGSKTTWNGRYVHEMRNSKIPFRLNRCAEKWFFQLSRQWPAHQGV